MRKFLLTLTLALLIAIVLVACGASDTNTGEQSQSEASTEEAEDADGAESTGGGEPGDDSTYSYKTKEEGDVVIGFSQAVMNHPFRIANVESAKQIAEELGVEIIVTDGQGEVNTEISNIESLISRNVDAIIVSSLSGKGIYPAYQQIADAEIPLIIAASGVPEDPGIPYISYVATDEVEMGQKAATYIAEIMNEEGKIVVLDGVTESTNSELRRQGFMPEIEKYPGIEVVAHQSGEWLRLPAMQVMTNILQANSEIDAVFAQNDEMAFGAIEAIKNAGREGEIKVFGMDAQKEALEMIKNGDNYTMTVKNEWDLETAVRLAVDAVRGKEIPKREVLEAPVIDDSNVDEYYDPESIF